MTFVLVCAMLLIFPVAGSAQEVVPADASGGVEFRGSQGHRFKVPHDMVEEKHPGFVALVPVDEYVGKKILQYDDRFKVMQETIDIMKSQIAKLQEQIAALQTNTTIPVQNSNQTVSVP